MSFIVLDIELTDKNINKELGLFIDGSVQGFSFCPPKTFKHNRQTTWNTSHLQGIAWSSGCKVMNAEVFAKGLEKCRLLTRLLGQNVENLDDYAAVAERAHSGKGPGYCYMIGRGPNSCLLGHMTGLLFCLCVKIFLPSFFNSVDF